MEPLDSKYLQGDYNTITFIYIQNKNHLIINNLKWYLKHIYILFDQYIFSLTNR